MSKEDTSIVFGCFEPVTFPELGIENTIAKIDTGAYTGALHCSHIEEVIREDGKKILRFIPSNNKEFFTETSDYEVNPVRSSNGHQSDRFTVKTEIEVRGKRYPITIGLTNRSKMQREVLIGRRFLRDNNIVVDVRINKEYDTDREGKLNK